MPRFTPSAAAPATDAETREATRPAVPDPAVMPVDRAAWRRQLNLSNFVNTYTQLRDLESLPDCRKVLIVGPGQGLETAVLRWRGFEVVTVDIDETFAPDHIGSVHDLHMFGDAEFDAVVASHVLEHLAVPYLDRALQELARVARFALVYLPVHGRHVQLRLKPGFARGEVSVVFDLFNPLDRPDGVSPRYMAGQHFWEVGLRGFGTRALVRRMSRWFEVLRVYRNHEWLPSKNFVLRSRREIPGTR